jgi:hypothetical protein
VVFSCDPPVPNCTPVVLKVETNLGAGVNVAIKPYPTLSPTEVR